MLSAIEMLFCNLWKFAALFWIDSDFTIKFSIKINKLMF